MKKAKEMLKKNPNSIEIFSYDDIKKIMQEYGYGKNDNNSKDKESVVSSFFEF